MDTRANLRRLSDLGVSGQQPAIMALCQMTTSEKAQITEAILKQKVANNKKAEALYTEHRERQQKAEESEEAAKAFEAQWGQDPPADCKDCHWHLCEMEKGDKSE